MSSHRRQYEEFSNDNDVVLYSGKVQRYRDMASPAHNRRALKRDVLRRRNNLSDVSIIDSAVEEGGVSVQDLESTDKENQTCSATGSLGLRKGTKAKHDLNPLHWDSKHGTKVFSCVASECHSIFCLSSVV